jgi:tetratricopeptide (TPR) repeat protein
MGFPRTLLLVSVLTALPAVASAQSAKDKKAASEKVKQAIAKSQAGDHEAAITLYNDAYKIIPQPLLLSNIGAEYQQMGKAVEARDFFCKYLAADPTGSNVGYATAQAKTLYIDLGGIKDVKDEDVCKPLVKPEEQAPPPDDDKDKDKDTKSPPEPIAPTTETRQSPLRWVGVGAGVLGVGVFGLGIY